MMKQLLQIIRKISLVLFGALHFRIFGLVDFLRTYLTIERSGLFDAEFYRKCLDVEDRNRRDPYPLVHYLARGAREAKDPHPLFDTAYYMMQCPDIAESGINPLIHFIQDGVFNARKPNPLFDTAYYLRKYTDVAEASLNPLAHYPAKWCKRTSEAESSIRYRLLPAKVSRCL